MLIASHPEVRGVVDITRAHIEAFKTWFAARTGYRRQRSLSKTTLGMRMGHLRVLRTHRRVGLPRHPPRIPVFASDRPIKDRPLPRFLDDPSAVKLLAAARALPDAFDRLALELLARTGMRKGELLGLTIDAVV
jgi:integrase